MAVLSPQKSSPSTSPLQLPQISASTNPNHPPLPPIVTNSPRLRSTLQRPPSFAQKRLSTQSNGSGHAQGRSRPPSHVYPIFHSSLQYTCVRDFAYPTLHPFHYGPPAESSATASSVSTPISEITRRLSVPLWDNSKGGWSAGNWGKDGGAKQDTPNITLQDGPPWSEDEDLHSPVVRSSKHRRHKPGGYRPSSDIQSNPSFFASKEQRSSSTSHHSFPSAGRSVYAGKSGDGGETYYLRDADEVVNGPGGELVTYPPGQARHSNLQPYNVPGQRDSHFATLLPNRSYVNHDLRRSYDSDEGSGASSPDRPFEDDSRYSRDYQFTIASPDEEMHGKAVALFDFQRENENELPLMEGQVIWVSYRHGQGWLVAEDPKTQESGLVPEEYVRLLRDIQGGIHSLTGELDSNLVNSQLPNQDEGTPVDEERHCFGHSPSTSNGVNGYQHPPVVSVFSTSSKDLQPYPQHLLGTQHGQAPPQVVHYQGQRGGSQAGTPTLTTPNEGLPAAAPTETPEQANKRVSSSRQSSLGSDNRNPAQSLQYVSKFGEAR
ncbi:MAG: HOG (high osmolarity glycerol) pathway protein [Trizodia sp. TS-e1964]|nr:MAG: HOG (high osmolarity glycerol) pathway protein [Trizodia sp. TS-e1964]